MTNIQRLYQLVAINNKTGDKTYLLKYPATHKEACIVKSKYSYHPCRRIELEDVTCAL